MTTAYPTLRALTAGFALVGILLVPMAAADAQTSEPPASGAPSVTEPPPAAQPPAADTPPQAEPDAPMDDDDMVSPPVVDPKGVETQSVSPADHPLQRPDGFGDEATMKPVPVLLRAAKSTWDEGFDNIVANLKLVDAEMARLKLTPSGAPLVVYTATDDSGFSFDVEVPFSGATTEKPGEGFEFSASPAGKALRFTHRGPYDAMDPTYEQIANLLDAKDLEAQELYVEEYRSDPRTTGQDDLVIDIWVPLK